MQDTSCSLNENIHKELVNQIQECPLQGKKYYQKKVKTNQTNKNPTKQSKNPQQNERTSEI